MPEAIPVDIRTPVTRARAAARARSWLASVLDPSARKPSMKLAVLASVVFIAALGVRFLHWQDSNVEIAGGKFSLGGVFERYRKEARRTIEEGGIVFPRNPPDPGNARMLAHPPGYSILIAGLLALNDDPVRPLWLLQAAFDAFAAVLMLLVAAELLGLWPAFVGAMLVALSPQLAYYSLLLTPDSLAVPPILLAIYLIIKAWKRPRVIYIILAGALIGLSCWLAANAMLLAPLLSLVVFFAFDSRKRFMLAVALTASTGAVIAPITIRNAVVFHRFVPLSIQAGLSLVEGIGDYDKEGRLGMPRSDREAREKDAEWNDRPDYDGSLWNPDGIDRDHTRLARGLAVVRSNPGWFAGVMFRRAASMVSYNDSRPRQWPENTASAPSIVVEPHYSHPSAVAGESQPTWFGQPAVLVRNGAIIPEALAVASDRRPVSSISPAELVAGGTVFSHQATTSLQNGGETLRIAGDGSAYGDQLSSAPILVRKNTDYVLVLPVRLSNADMAIKVTDIDRRKTLAITAVEDAQKQAAFFITKHGGGDSTTAGQMTAIQLPFASGYRNEVRVVVSNNAAATAAPSMEIGQAELFEIGGTPYIWTRYPRAVIAAIQRGYSTGAIRILVAIGIALMLFARRFRALIILLAVPAYYLAIQAPLHTEYRYTLSIHYFLFAMSGVSLVCLAAVLGQASRAATRRLFFAARKAPLAAQKEGAQPSRSEAS